ncbi:helix-turn-helix domain-containing protein [Spongiactinospora sp. 9N601]|uniref:helix-turn-helix domain-containing protein n=1 Tax=Spongiactinospora sp. 9N601 TaxID=3375149 RepID=UPI0037A270EA
MPDDRTREPGARLRELRFRRGFTQEGLAEAAGLSVQCIKKIEQGGSARMETYHRIAKALGVRTVWFVAPGSPEPVAETENVALLADIRGAIIPPVGMDGNVLYEAADAEDVSLPRLREAVDASALAYHGDNYDHLAQVLPELIKSAQYHVSRFDETSAEGREAIRLRADALSLAGRYLIQIRAMDLALPAIQQSLRDARAIGNIPLAAAAISMQDWAMLRQGRFDEVERLAAAAAHEMEPRVSVASKGELAAWGWMLLSAATAAVRNNRTREAEDYVSIARTAATRFGREQQGLPGYKAFGPVSVALIAAEVATMAGEPAQGLEEMERITPDDGRPPAPVWNRGQVEKSYMHLEMGDTDRATEVLQELKAQSPQWLRYQQRAKDAAEGILKARTRIPTAAQREIADFLGVKE